MRPTSSVLGASLLTLLLLAGCGGEDKSATDGSAASEASSSPSVKKGADDGSADDGADDGSADDGADGEADDGEAAPGKGTKYCKLLSTDFATLFANIGGPEDVTEAIGIIKQIGEQAPPSVKDQWATMQGAFGQVEDALVEAARLQKQAAAGTVTQKRLQKETARLTQEMQAINTPANAKAGKAVAEHAAKFCGQTLG